VNSATVPLRSERGDGAGVVKARVLVKFQMELYNLGMGMVIYACMSQYLDFEFDLSEPKQGQARMGQRGENDVVDMVLNFEILLIRFDCMM
jgi:hypothetical protein